MNNPLVSILISSYNQRDFIETAIFSALDQDYTNIEIIVIDDASTDGSHEIIELISTEHGKGRMRVIYKPKNEGNVFCRNIGLAEASGDYVCFLDGDDMYLPGKISTQVTYMENYPDCVFSYHDVDVFDTISGESIFFIFR